VENLQVHLIGHQFAFVGAEAPWLKGHLDSVGWFVP